MSIRSNPAVQGASSSTPATQASRALLSCISCRSRKVKCNRVSPCIHCVRLGMQCVFPARKKNQARRPRHQDELLGRLARLEQIVSAAQTPGPAHHARKNVAATTPAPSDRTAPAKAAEDVNPPSGDHGKTPIHVPEASDPSLRYMSRDFWSNLCTEVEGLKQALGQTSSDSEEEPEQQEEMTPPGSNQSSGSGQQQAQMSSGSPVSHAFLGTLDSTGRPEVLAHPSPKEIQFLCSTYFSNVDLVFKVLHRPTAVAAMEAFASSPADSRNIDRPTEALFFAIYFGAVTTLDPQTCLSQLGEEKSILLSRYRLATEVALARADYLNNTRLEPLQAFAIYIACLRADNSQSRAAWALLGLAVQLGKGLKLHRDGDGRTFPPYEAEMRRRLWWSLVILDVRGVEDRGTEAIIAGDSYNTAMLTNINDADFGPGSRVPLAGVEGPTDVTFALCSAMSSGFFLTFGDPSEFARATATHGATQLAAFSFQQTEHGLIKHVQKLEALFIERMDPSHLVSTITATVVRIVTLKLWLSLQYPFQVVRPAANTTAPLPRSSTSGSTAATSAANARPRVSREGMLRTALAVMELAEAEQRAPGSERYGWWTKLYVQWHPLAVALAELCAQPVGELADRAWQVVDRVLPLWSERIADSKRGTLWKPIRKLLKKARAARIESQLRGLGLGQDVDYRVLKEDDGDTADTQPTTGTEQTGGVSTAMEDDDELPQRNDDDNNGADMFASATTESGTFITGEPISVPSRFLFLQEPAQWFNMVDNTTTGLGQEEEDELMDWSAWNEFVTDTNGELGEEEGNVQL
ncbi:hypothetical protein QBC46DRAFT_380753 [Diplogelasinospora grovesii]|uniref:Zn(2)-C6 fungal-type domain-containing protein n=1 Tax=Diplogelasinospora grovesii TaxID=303347 RepID=A0AAN6S6F6_9PEZI|nr:hypothetical protein QBC46DRAFT_380753 [Diplogelasinospora grovesii]